jgi:hypothetical protein
MSGSGYDKATNREIVNMKEMLAITCKYFFVKIVYFDIQSMYNRNSFDIQSFVLGGIYND